MWVVCDETYEMWQGGFEDMDIPDDLKLNEQTVRQIKALRLWAMNRRRHSAGGHLLGQQAMEVSSQARAATIAYDCSRCKDAPSGRLCRWWRDDAAYQRYPSWSCAR